MGNFKSSFLEESVRRCHPSIFGRRLISFFLFLFFLFLFFPFPFPFDNYTNVLTKTIGLISINQIKAEHGDINNLDYVFKRTLNHPKLPTENFSVSQMVQQTNIKKTKFTCQYKAKNKKKKKKKKKNQNLSTFKVVCSLWIGFLCLGSHLLHSSLVNEAILDVVKRSQPHQISQIEKYLIFPLGLSAQIYHSILLASQQEDNSTDNVIL